MSAVNDYSFNLSASQDGKPLRLVAVYKGKDLGDQFSIAVEKTQHKLIIDEKYFFIPLKIKDAEGNETWVKIDKSDLKTKLHLSGSDLKGVKTEELQHHMLVHLERAAKLQDNLELKGIEKSFHNFIKFFVGHFVLSPTINQAVKEAIADKKIAEIADIYVKGTGSIQAAVKERLKEKNENALTIFDDGVISDIIDAKIMGEVNKLLEKEKAPLWNEKKVKELHDLRVVDYLKRHPDKLSEDLLKKIDIFNLPYSVLAEIPITKENMALMAKTWQHVVGNLYVKGRLDALNVERDQRGIIIQAHYAGEFLEAYYALPQQVKEHLAPFIKDLDKDGTQLTSITNFVIYNHADLNSRSTHSQIEKLQQQQQIFNEKIRPEIHKMIASLIENSKDANSLIEAYTSESLKIPIQLFSKLSDNEPKILNIESLQLLFLKEIEFILVSKYSFTTSQIEELQQNKKMPILNDKIKNEILEGQHSSLFSAEQQISLMKLNDILNGYNPSGGSLAVDKQEEIKKNLDILKKDPNFLQAIKKFNPSLFSGFSQLKGFLPPFLFNLIKLGCPEEFETIPKIPVGISFLTIFFVTTYLNELDTIEKMSVELESTQRKAEHVLKKYKENPDSISKKERLTTSELGCLNRASRLGNEAFRKKLNQLGLVHHNEDVEKFFIKVDKSSAVLAELNKVLGEDINAHYKSGDLYAYNGLKKQKFDNEPLKFFFKITAYICDNLVHGGKIYKKNGIISASHIWEGLGKDTFGLNQIATSDVWSLDLSALVPNSTKEILKTLLGDVWREEVNKMYQTIETGLQEKMLGRNYIKNDSERKAMAGFANYAEVLNIAGLKIKGHTREKERSFNKLHSKFFTTTLQEKMICSEFVSKATLVSMVELNKRLSKLIIERMGSYYDNKVILEDMQDKGIQVSKEMQDYVKGIRHYGEKSSITKGAEKEWRQLLKERGYNPADIEVTIRVGNEEILDLPYSRKERLKAIHPGRMISLLADKGCVTKRPVPPAVSQLLDIE